MKFIQNSTWSFYLYKSWNLYFILKLIFNLQFHGIFCTRSLFLVLWLPENNDFLLNIPQIRQEKTLLSYIFDNSVIGVSNRKITQSPLRYCYRVVLTTFLLLLSDAADIYVFKVSNRNFRIMYEFDSKLLKTPEQFYCPYFWLLTGFTHFTYVSIVDFEQISSGWVSFLLFMCANFCWKSTIKTVG